MMKKMLYAIAIIFSLAVIYVIGNIIWAYIHYYDPTPIELIHQAKGVPRLDTSRTYTATIWNIGYGGLGAEADFFYDGGQMVRPPKELFEQYQKSIEEWVSKDTSDFLMLQEVDVESKRSYFYPQRDRLKLAKNGHTANFATNYHVKFIPQPWLEPMGYVHSGLLTISPHLDSQTYRHQLPGAFGFPKQLFFLRRCLLVSEYPLANGKSLYLINIHNSAYDDDGKLKKQEMNYLKQLLTQIYQSGHYVVCGGDWNQCPPGFKYNQLAQDATGDYFHTNIAEDFIPGWQWIYDPLVPTNRKNDQPYVPRQTFVTLIDFYLVSPNVKVHSVRGIDLKFKNSDHQPVTLTFSFQ